jgi:hypothetical protein
VISKMALVTMITVKDESTGTIYGAVLITHPDGISSAAAGSASFTIRSLWATRTRSHQMVTKNIIDCYAP